MTARMYDDNDAESSGGWRRDAPPPTSEIGSWANVPASAEGPG
jgi:hypothetical protein